MPSHIALLRGINVGGHNMIAMSNLRELVTKLGFKNAKTLLQSGNLVFDATGKSDATLERQLESETAKRFGIKVDYVIRSIDEWNKIIARNPFPRESKRDPSHMLVTFFTSPPGANDVKALRAAIKGPETIEADGKQLYIVYPTGIGRSKLTGALIEKTLKNRGTARNWNTILKLAAMVKDD